MSRLWGGETLFGQPQTEMLVDWQPDLDIEQKKNMYVVRADLPGVEPENIKVTLDNGNLVVEGKRETKVEEHKGNFRRVERVYGSFYRCVNLPDASDAKDVEAHCKNGVLEIEVPIPASAKHKKIEVMVD